jgi:hexosaminidase
MSPSLFLQEPWQDYCVEPPCGQFNPVNPNVSLVLGQLYKDFVDAFGPVDLFHMGGDEVNLNCWKTSQEVIDYLEAQGQVSPEVMDYLNV